MYSYHHSPQEGTDAGENGEGAVGVAEGSDR